MSQTKIFEGSRKEVKLQPWYEPIPENLSPIERRLWLCDYQLKHANPATDTEFIFTLVKIKKHLKEKL